MLWTFVPVAVLVSLTPGPGMALVVRNAAVGGTGAAVSRTKRMVASTWFARRLEQATGAVLLALAGRLAVESR